MLCPTGYIVSGALLGVASLAQATPQTFVDPAAFSSFRQTVTSLGAPRIEEPQWLKDKLAAEAAAAGAKRAATTMTVTYDVSTRGTVTADFNEFKTQANQTLNDARGWSRMNIRFDEVASGGEFSLVLAEASQIGTFAGCGSEYSCRSGRYVLINQDRWQSATPSWNQGGGSLRDYRHMVVNHETGHWLGHGHENCGGTGQSAPVMQQQSIDLQGCAFNPWPLDFELTSSQLGI